MTAADIAAYTPSLQANNSFGQDNTSFSIRGFVAPGATSPSVSIYFADVIAPRANGNTTAGNGADVGSFFDLQNVQVLKGPQGTLSAATPRAARSCWCRKSRMATSWGTP